MNETGGNWQLKRRSRMKEGFPLGLGMEILLEETHLRGLPA